jgi:hypothetical protein
MVLEFPFASISGFGVLIFSKYLKIVSKLFFFLSLPVCRRSVLRKPGPLQIIQYSLGCRYLRQYLTTCTTYMHSTSNYLIVCIFGNTFFLENGTMLDVGVQCVRVLFHQPLKKRVLLYTLL